MITDVPAPGDFEAVGVSLLNQAWDTAITLYLDLHEVADLEGDQVQEYWTAANTKLATALSIA